jgi:hypothetical protein
MTAPPNYIPGLQQMLREHVGCACARCLSAVTLPAPSHAVRGVQA